MPKASGVERRTGTIHVNILLAESKIFKSIEYIPHKIPSSQILSACPINATPTQPSRLNCYMVHRIELGPPVGRDDSVFIPGEGGLLSYGGY